MEGKQAQYVEQEKQRRATVKERKKAAALHRRQLKQAGKLGLAQPDTREPLTSAQRRQIARAQKSNARAAAKPRLGDITAKHARSGIGDLGGIVRTLGGDVKQIGYGFADTAADYGTAVVKDTADLVRHPARPQYGRTGHLLKRDAIAYLQGLDLAIPDPSNAKDRKAAYDFWKRDPLIAASLFVPFTSKATRRASEGAIASAIRRANPELPKREVARLAKQESRRPGYAAAHGVKGGLPERMLKGEFGEARGRSLSRTPEGRAGQRAYDRASQVVEARFGPGAKFSTSQRAARAKERGLRQERARTEAEVVRLERTMRKGIGRLGRNPAGREALIATLEAPKDLSPRQAVQAKLADLHTVVERPRTTEEATARVAALEKRLRKDLRPLVDELYPVGARRREQALRNVRVRGKRAQRSIETSLEMTGIRGDRRQGGSVLEDAYGNVEAKIAEMAARPDADPSVRAAAALIAERDKLRAELSDPEVVFGDATPDLGVERASPDAAKRLKSQIAALDHALESGLVDEENFGHAVAAAERLSGHAEEVAGDVLSLSPEQFSARRNRIAQRYAEKGLLPEGVSPEARGFFPHRDEFETVGPGHGAAVGLPPTGAVIGRPTPGRAFESRRNALKLYEQGRVQTNPRVLSNLVRQRERFTRTREARRYMYENGAPIHAGDRIPDNVFLVRNPDVGPEDIPASVRAAAEAPERYADAWLRKGNDIPPEWLADLENVRAIPAGVAKTLLPDVFSSAPRGVVASIAGTLNSLARAVTIYTPYGGTRYIARNTPQNMILLAITQPRAFLKVHSGIELRHSHPDIYRAIEAETGTVPAAAGLPELAGRSANFPQRIERVATDASRQIAGALGEVSDQPWRVASWIQYARQYDFKTPEEMSRLLNDQSPEIARVRADISQHVRNDMIDFDALPPEARETLSRYFFILPFVYGAGKWPLTYLREYPVRTAIAALVAAQHSREETPGRVTSVLESGRTTIGGREVDLGWLSPVQPAASTAEDIGNIAQAVPKGPRQVALATSSMLSPQYRELVGSEYGGWERSKRAFIPGYSTAQRVGEGGSVGDQALRFLGSDIRYVEKRKEKRDLLALERKTVLPKLRGKVDAKDYQYISRAYDIYEGMQKIRAETSDSTEEGEPYYRAVLEAEARYMAKQGIIDAEDEKWLVRLARKGTYDEVRKRRDHLIQTVYENTYLKPTRNAAKLAGYQRP